MGNLWGGYSLTKAPRTLPVTFLTVNIKISKEKILILEELNKKYFYKYLLYRFDNKAVKFDDGLFEI